MPRPMHRIGRGGQATRRLEWSTASAVGAGNLTANEGAASSVVCVTR